MKDQLISWRRDFHQHPEIGMNLPRTSGIVADVLQELGYKVQTGIGQSGVVGMLQGAHEGPCVLARFDMDALPIVEQTGAPYASVVEGAMHACGHDGHTAIGLGTASILCKLQDRLKGTVKLVFQPGEEGFDGALAMIRDGVLEAPEPVKCLAMHLWNSEPVGWIGLTEGAVMAGAEKIRIEVQGRGGHGSAPELALDPVLAGSQIVVAIQTVVSRSVDPLEAAVVSITSMHAGTTFNVIPPNMVMEGTIRTFNPDIRKVVLQRLKTVVNSTAEAMGCQAELEIEKISTPVINQPDLTIEMQQLVKELLPASIMDTGCRVMGSEDMAEFQDRIPGVYIFVGSNSTEKGLVGAHHNPQFDFDEDVLPLGAGLMTAAIARMLGSA
ncbi:MAG: amidohydrolase [Anaerolineales bacterium]|nr:amidohydrolase [Anaerolineales bacterium]